MSQITLAELKRACQAVEHDDDDDLIGDLQVAAEAFVTDYLRRDLDAELANVWPQACVHAVRLLVAHWYEHRSAMAEGSTVEVPFGVRDLLKPHRDLS